MPKNKSPFGGNEASEYNALWQTLHACGEDYAEFTSKKKDGYEVYDFLNETPRTSLTVQIVDKLHELGYEIRRKDDAGTTERAGEGASHQHERGRRGSGPTAVTRRKR